MAHSRKPGFRFILFSETQGIKRAGAVLTQITNTQARLLELERKLKETEELERRLQELESLLETREGQSRWG
jgi:cell shape-determining protein MreC